jgi:hypothetical protein
MRYALLLRLVLGPNHIIIIFIIYLFIFSHMEFIDMSANTKFSALHVPCINIQLCNIIEMLLCNSTLFTVLY